MLKLKSFAFGPFQENTYLLWDDNKTAVIFDPGNSNQQENNIIKNFISENGLKLERLLLTHAHIDHVMGNQFIFDEYGLLPEVHEEDNYFIENMMRSAQLYGINCEQSPSPCRFIKDEEEIEIGNIRLKCIHVPGHSPGGICFYLEKEQILIAGDVLFYGSIGRTDLPKGDHETLINSIISKIFPLGDKVKVFSGHGPSTTIGFEKANNPFLT